MAISFLTHHAKKNHKIVEDNDDIECLNGHVAPLVDQICLFWIGDALDTAMEFY